MFSYHHQNMGIRSKIFKKEIQMVKKPTNKYFASLIIRKMQSKTTPYITEADISGRTRTSTGVNS